MNVSQCQAGDCASIPHNGNRAYKYYLDGYKVNGKRKRLFFNRTKAPPTGDSRGAHRAIQAFAGL